MIWTAIADQTSARRHFGIVDRAGHVFDVAVLKRICFGDPTGFETTPVSPSPGGDGVA
jgi:hypothetical protein